MIPSSLPLTMGLTGCSIMGGDFFLSFSVAHPLKTSATLVPNSKFLALMSRGSRWTCTLDLWIYNTAPLIAHIRVGRHSGKKSPACLPACLSRLLPMERWYREQRAQSFFFLPIRFNFEPHSATYIQFTILIWCAAQLIMPQRCSFGSILQLLPDLVVTIGGGKQDKPAWMCVCVCLCRLSPCCFCIAMYLFSVRWSRFFCLSPLKSHSKCLLPPRVGLIKTLLC